MHLKHPDIRAYWEMSIKDLMSRIDNLDGDFLLCYRLDLAGKCADQVLVLDHDPYSENDDPFLDHDGHQYNWEIDLFSMKRVKANYVATFGNDQPNNLVNAAKYYVINRAYIQPEDS